MAAALHLINALVLQQMISQSSRLPGALANASKCRPCLQQMWPGRRMIVHAPSLQQMRLPGAQEGVCLHQMRPMSTARFFQVPPSL